MINPENIDILKLNHVSLEDRKALPETPCIYFAIDAQNEIQYIGMSVNPKRRWQNHHRFEQVQGCRIAYLECDKDLLLSVETALINHFSPPLNQFRLKDSNDGNSRKNETITLSLSPKHKAALEQMAVNAGYTWGENGKPNISAWLRAIAENESPEPATRNADDLDDRIAKVKRLSIKLSAAINALE